MAYSVLKKTYIYLQLQDIMQEHTNVLLKTLLVAVNQHLLTLMLNVSIPCHIHQFAHTQMLLCSPQHIIIFIF